MQISNIFSNTSSKIRNINFSAGKNTSVKEQTEPKNSEVLKSSLDYLASNNQAAIGTSQINFTAKTELDYQNEIKKHKNELRKLSREIDSLSPRKDRKRIDQLTNKQLSAYKRIEKLYEKISKLKAKNNDD